MKKRVVFVLFLVLFMLLFSSFVSAFSSVTPTTFYEGTNQLLYVNINNYQQSYTITNIEVNIPGTITEVIDILGWDDSNNGSYIHWYGGTVETNVINAVFAFRADMPFVNSDDTITLEVIKTNLIGTKESEDLTLNLLNDETPPSVLSISPADGTVVRAGISAQDIEVVVEENETAILSVTYTYGDCNTSETEILTCVSGTCTGVADFSTFSEGTDACFSVTATNTGLESDTVTGQIGFDSTQPTVHALYPSGDAIGTVSDFVIYSSDNMPGELICELSIDSELVASFNAQNGMNTTISINNENLTEGSHDWSISCDDAVGLNEMDSGSFVIDNTAPEIISTPINGSSLFRSGEIVIEVTDNEQVETITYSRDLNLSNWADGENILIVTATDTVGNVAEETFVFNIINEYNFDFTLNPASVLKEGNVDLTGTVVMEDGSAIVETIAVFEFGDYENLTIVNGEFSYSFSVNSVGTYDIRVVIYGQNGYDYTVVKQLEVILPSSSSSSGRGRSGNPASDFYSSTGIETTSTPTLEFTLPSPPTSSGGQNMQEEPKEYDLSQDDASNEMTGAAVGGGNPFADTKWWIVSVLVLVGLGVLFYASRFRPKKKEITSSDSLNWTDYFDRNKGKY